MASLTDGAIRRAIKDVNLTGKQKSLADGEGRGVGRLILVLRPMPTRVLAEWMAQQWRDGKRIKAKLGNYPSITLAEARDVFRRDYADAIQKGRSIKITTDTRPGTVGDLPPRTPRGLHAKLRFAALAAREGDYGGYDHGDRDWLDIAVADAGRLARTGAA